MTSNPFKDYMRGFASCMDLFPETSRNPFHRNDAEALHSDWEKVADDMRRAYRAEDLPEKWMRALENTGMSSRHEHLNKLLEQDNDDDR